MSITLAVLLFQPSLSPAYTVTITFSFYFLSFATLYIYTCCKYRILHTYNPSHAHQLCSKRQSPSGLVPHILGYRPATAFNLSSFRGAAIARRHNLRVRRGFQVRETKTRFHPRACWNCPFSYAPRLTVPPAVPPQQQLHPGLSGNPSLNAAPHLVSPLQASSSTAYYYLLLLPTTLPLSSSAPLIAHFDTTYLQRASLSIFILSPLKTYPILSSISGGTRARRCSPASSHHVMAGVRDPDGHHPPLCQVPSNRRESAPDGAVWR